MSDPLPPKELRDSPAMATLCRLIAEAAWREYDAECEAQREQDKNEPQASKVAA